MNSIGIFLYYVFEKKETAANPIMMYLVLIFTLCRVVTKSYKQQAGGGRREETTQQQRTSKRRKKIVGLTINNLKIQEELTNHQDSGNVHIFILKVVIYKR